MSEISRPPIVTILGHVDHGKTTLLDFIRKTTVAAREQGGITQHIGAYQIEISDKGNVISNDKKEEKNHISSRVSRITFIDTPGHAAFEKMRSRGAKVADIAVLVVAIDDGIMPQTIEAIKHIKGQGLPAGRQVPMIVAVNKLDLPGINAKTQLEKIKKQLSDNDVLVEEYGGDVPIVPLSAKTGEGVDKLLEMILLVAELHELKGDPSTKTQGVVIESSLDKSKGPITTILIRNGTLKKGDQILVGGVKGRVRGLFDYNGKSIDSAGPSTPVEVLGLETTPAVGSLLGEEALEVEQIKKVQSLIDKLRQGEEKILGVIIKADKQGSLEAIESSLEKFSAKGGLASGQNEDHQYIKIVSKGTGDISEADVKLASATHSIVIGFNVKIGPTASKLAETEHVLIRTYNVIYELLEEIEDVVEGMLKVDIFEEILGTAQVLAEFPYGKNEKIAGCKVLEGQISRGSRIRVVRGEEVIGEAKVKTLKKAREEVNKVDKGDECGMMFDPPLDFQVGDKIEAFRKI